MTFKYSQHYIICIYEHDWIFFSILNIDPVLSSQLLQSDSDVLSKTCRNYAHVILWLQSHAEYILRQWTPGDVLLRLPSSSLRIVQGKLRQLSVNDECLRERLVGTACATYIWEGYRDQMTITTTEHPLDNDVCTASCWCGPKAAYSILEQRIIYAFRTLDIETPNTLTLSRTRIININSEKLQK